jgi:hypothetical protein
MARGRKPKTDRDIPRLGFRIPEFCRSHGISEDFYYRLQRDGLENGQRHNHQRRGWRSVAARARGRHRRQRTHLRRVNQSATSRHEIPRRLASEQPEMKRPGTPCRANRAKVKEC